LRARHACRVCDGLRNHPYLGHYRAALFGYSDTWQLIINTGTTIVTFLMVFLVQNTQNRDARALHLKLDELLRSLKDARNRLIDLENCTDEEIDQVERQFKALRRREERNKANGIAQTSSTTS
jgi:low affinity Fe/Cu permease